MTDPTMPVIFTRFEQYNTDGKEGLSPDEITRMPSDDIRALFAYGVPNSVSHAGDKIVQFDDAMQVLQSLKPSIQTTLFRKLAGHEVRDEYFRRMATINIERAVEILLDIVPRELVMERGTKLGDVVVLNDIYLLTRNLPQPLHEKIFCKLREKNPALTGELEQYGADVRSAGQQRKPTHANAVEALKGHLHKRSLPRIFAFGELHDHDQIGGALSTGERFATEIMPWLARQGGVFDFVIEYLPCDIPRKELEEYFQTGIIDERSPLLNIYANQLSYKGARHKVLWAILEQARILRKEGLPIQIHGGADSFLEPVHGEDPVTAITRKTATQVMTLLWQGKRVATYNGALHNDTPSRDPRKSIAAILSLPPTEYLAVDLIVPDDVPPSLPKWYQKALLAPEVDVVMLPETPDSITIIYAKGKPL